MKNILKKVLVVFFSVCAFLLFKNIKVYAKVSSNEVFEVKIGEDKLPIYYYLVNSQTIFKGNEEIGNLEDGVLSLKDGNTYLLEGNNVLNELKEVVGTMGNGIISMNNSEIYTVSDIKVKEKIVFNVMLSGLGEEEDGYVWEHTFCYKINSSNEVCETDLTGDSEGVSQAILSNKIYSFSFWDGHMPYYSEDLIFEYVKFKNKFTRIEDNQEIILDDIVFENSNNEISYYYNYDVVVDEYESDSKFYVGKNNVSASLINNSSSSLQIDYAPKYRFINEVCVSEEKCDVFEADVVYSNKVAIPITPYIGNISFTFNNSYFISDNDLYSEIIFRTSLQCRENCSSRRIEGEKVVIYEKVYNYDYTSPYVEVESTNVSSFDEYKKKVNLKISVKDSGVGLDEESFIYKLGWNNNGTCSFTNEIFYYENGVSFDLGSNLKDGAICMYFTAKDKLGNSFKSDNYYFYFDNNAPVLNISNNNYLDDKYYNEISLNVSFSDSYSGIDSLYYLWSLEQINDENYLDIKNNGKIYDNNGILSSLNDIGKDGEYYLYFLTFDKLGNYKVYSVGKYKVDISVLKNEEVSVTVSNYEGYSNSGIVKVIINEMESGEEFKCGYFNDEETVTFDMLNLKCKNNTDMSFPANLEGEYSLWIYASDKANNYSLLEVKEGLLIDTRGPFIEYSVLKDDDNYHITNEIELVVGDLNGVNSTSLKYGWFVASENNVTSNDLVNSFTNGGIINYPKSHYGEYKLYVSACDDLGNEKFISLDKIFKIDTDIIRISLIGEEKITIIRGQSYKDAGAIAYKGDVSSGGRVSEIKISGEVNNKKAGTYYVTYSSGEGELMVSVTRKVVVENDFPYIIIFISLILVGSIVLGFRLFYKKRSCGGE